MNKYAWAIVAAISIVPLLAGGCNLGLEKQSAKSAPAPPTETAEQRAADAKAHNDAVIAQSSYWRKKLHLAPSINLDTSHKVKPKAHK